MTKTTKLEAERKFLLRKGIKVSPITIQQRYAPDGSVYRVERETSGDLKMMVIEKEDMLDGVRLETIKTYPEDESEKFYSEMMGINNAISKKRIVIDHIDGVDIVVDTYIDMDLAVMEIEYLSEYNGDISIRDARYKIYNFQLPEYCESKVIKEVTGDPAFSNRALAEDIITPTPRFNGKILD